MKERRNHIYILLFVLGCAVYFTLVAAHWSPAYIDFGDGNYLYISWRISEGKALYRDILSPQPPMHLYLGGLLVTLADLTGGGLTLVRTFSALLHLTRAGLVLLIALALFGSGAVAMASGIIYLFLPIGFWWGLGYQSEPLEIVFLLLGFLFFVRFRKGDMVKASVFGALAAFTNMTAVPYLLFNHLYLLLRRRMLWLSYLLPMVIIAVLIVGGFELFTGGYVENVFLNQVGTFPKKELSDQSVVEYAMGKIAREGKDILFWEGGLILIALLGIIRFLKSERPGVVREYVGWYALLSLGSIVYVSKGATMDYIFCLGEPFVALFAGFWLVTVWQEWVNSGKESGEMGEGLRLELRWDSAQLIRQLSFFLLLVLLWIIPLFFLRATLEQRNYEQSAAGVQEVCSLITEKSEAGEEILSPPYYAFLTRRPLIGEYSSIFIWTMKYWNERLVFRQPGEGVDKVEQIAEALERQELPVIVLDLNQTGRLREIREPVEEHYEQLGGEIRTLNTVLRAYVPTASN